MSIIVLLILLALIGLLVWALVTYVPMPQGFKTMIVVVAIVLCILLVLQVTGLINQTLPLLRPVR